MKVIKNRALNANSWTLRVNCHNCKSILEINANDVRSTMWGSGMDDYNRELVYVTECPCCESIFRLLDLPVAVKNVARGKK